MYDIVRDIYRVMDGMIGMLLIVVVATIVCAVPIFFILRKLIRNKVLLWICTIVGGLILANVIFFIINKIDLAID